MTDAEDPPNGAHSTIDASPFFLPGEGSSALLIHGLTGTPYEMRFLGERLAQTGSRVLGVKLAGHASTPEELSAATHDHWYQSVVVGFERLRAYGNPIVVVGQSAGAVLAARLAIDQGTEVAGLVLLAPAFFLRRSIWWTLKMLNLAHPWLGRVFLRGSGPDLHDAAARQVHPAMQLIPLKSLLELVRLTAVVRPQLGRLIQPLLIIHSLQDHLCPPTNVDFLLSRVSSSIKRVVFLEESFHVISVDSEKVRLADEVAKFIAQVCESSRDNAGVQAFAARSS
jgi:carboxylesterase